jgi:hypothetical protein
MAKALQFAPQFLMVVYFAVEDDGRVFCLNRLVTGVEVDDFQTSCTHRTESRSEDTLLVRPAVNQGCGSISNAIGICGPSFISKSGDSTQVLTPLSRARQSTDRRSLCEVHCEYAASSRAAE